MSASGTMAVSTRARLAASGVSQGDSLPSVTSPQLNS